VLRTYDPPAVSDPGAAALVGQGRRIIGLNEP
jgi:hypothetical protein